MNIIEILLPIIINAVNGLSPIKIGLGNGKKLDFSFSLKEE
jgi:hypothetical protein